VRALVIENDPVCLAGTVGDRLVQRGWDITELVVVPADRRASPAVEVAFPDPTGWDLVVVLGASWSVDDRAAVGSWISGELALLREAHAAGVPVLGICFGGQALATALGGGVERAPRPEVGWFAIETDEPALVAPGPWFEYHFDRWIPPPAAVEIARNAAASQAFRMGNSVGVQFHPEITVPLLELWLANGGAEHLPRLGLDPGRLLDRTRDLALTAERRAHQLVDAFLDHTTPT
jgi:GMP synthase-like glutamine amidotransferase